MTQAEASALVATLAAAWPRQPIEQATLDIYAHDLADLDFALAAQAVETVRRTATWFPTIAEIRSAAGEIELQAPSPMIAWSQATTLTYDRDAEVHPLVIRARGIVGDNWHWREASAVSLRKAFLAAYTEVRAEAIRTLTVPELTEREMKALLPPTTGTYARLPRIEDES